MVASGSSSSATKFHALSTASRICGRLHHPDVASLAGQPEDVLDDAVHPVGRGFDRVEVVAVTLLFGEFQPSVDDVQGVPDRG